jgi:hypothetical protein
MSTVKMMVADVAQLIDPCYPEAGATLPSKPATYSLYGLRVKSDLPLPLTPIENDDADLVIRFEGFIPRPDGNPPAVMTRVYQRQEKRWMLRFDNPNGHVLEFIYDRLGTTLSMRQSYPEWPDSLSVLLSVAMAAALHLQGRPALHATSLVKNGVAYLLMGSSGVGKSSLTAALAAEGLSFHADDVSALSWDSSGPVVHAGYPRLKITEQTADALGWPGDYLLPVFLTVSDYQEKWVDALRLPGGFHRGRVPLKAIYILSGRSVDLSTPRLETLSHGQAAMTIVQHLYGNSWLITPHAQAMALCARIAEKAAVHRLWLPDGLDRLRSTARFIMNDI